MPFGGEILRKLKNYKPTKFKAKDSYYDKEYADFAVAFIESLCRTKGTYAFDGYFLSFSEYENISIGYFATENQHLDFYSLLTL